MGGVVDDAMQSGRDLIAESGVHAGPVQHPGAQVDHGACGVEDQLVLESFPGGREPAPGGGLGRRQHLVDGHRSDSNAVSSRVGAIHPSPVCASR